MLNILLKKINFLLPAILITTGIILVFVMPLKFYSNNDLNIPVSIVNQTAKAAGSALGGDISIGLPQSQSITPLAIDNRTFTGKLSAFSAMVIDSRSNKILFSKDSETVRPLASISKLMSALVLLERNINWQATTTIESVDGNGDNVVNDGEQYSLEDLWHAALVGSSNRALQALVRHSGVSSDGFVILMNKKAGELNLNSLKFTEPTGLSANNVGNVKDTIFMLKEVLRFEKIYNTLQLPEYFIKPLDKDKFRRVYSTNWLLTRWVAHNLTAEKIAGKTGFIEDAGYNFVSSFKNLTGREIICAVLNSKDNESRFEECRDLVKWSLEKYVWPYQAEYNRLIE